MFFSNFHLGVNENFDTSSPCPGAADGLCVSELSCDFAAERSSSFGRASKPLTVVLCRALHILWTSALFWFSLFLAGLNKAMNKYPLCKLTLRAGQAHAPQQVIPLLSAEWAFSWMDWIVVLHLAVNKGIAKVSVSSAKSVEINAGGRSYPLPYACSCCDYSSKHGAEPGKLTREISLEWNVLGVTGFKWSHEFVFLQ